MGRRSPALLFVHLVWSTAERKRILPKTCDGQLASIIGHHAALLRCALFAFGCASDHCHAMLRVAATVAVADVAHQVKGGSSHDINAHHLMPEFRGWQAGYWAESVSPADCDPLVRYIRSQREHHDDSHPAESWQRE